MFEDTIVNFIEMLRLYSDKEIKSGDDLFERIGDNGDLVLRLCEAVMQTYDNIGKVKEQLVSIKRLLG